jgi:hypothetical protein
MAEAAERALVCELPQQIDQALVRGGFKAALGPPALNTLLHRVSVMSKLHTLEQLANPCQQPRVRELLARTRQTHARRGALPDKKPALTREPLEALLQTCDGSLAGLRDRALLLETLQTGRPGPGLLGPLIALGFRHRGRPAARAAGRDDGAHRAPLGGIAAGIFPPGREQLAGRALAGSPEGPLEA